MLRVALLLALSSAVLCQPAIVPRIVGGETPDPKQFPAQVAVIYHDEIICGGTLIDYDHVLTAAGCVDGKEPKDIKVTGGTVDLDNPQGGSAQTNFAIKIYRPSDSLKYETITSQDGVSVKYPVDDIALIRVSEAFKDSDFVKPIKIVNKDKELSESTACMIAGWGATKQGESPAPKKLNFVQATLSTLDKCLDMFDLPTTLTNITNACVKTVGSNKVLCKGDEGSGIICDNELFGLVSWGTDCTSKLTFAVSAKDAKWNQWIEDTVKKSQNDFSTTTTTTTTRPGTGGSTGGGSTGGGSNTSPTPTKAPGAGSTTPSGASALSAPVIILLGALSVARLL